MAWPEDQFEGSFVSVRWHLVGFWRVWSNFFSASKISIFWPEISFLPVTKLLSNQMGKFFSLLWGKKIENCKKRRENTKYEILIHRGANTFFAPCICFFLYSWKLFLGPRNKSLQNWKFKKCISHQSAVILCTCVKKGNGDKICMICP